MTGSASHLSFGWRSSQGWGRQKAPRLAACQGSHPMSMGSSITPCLTEHWGTLGPHNPHFSALRSPSGRPTPAPLSSASLHPPPQFTSLLYFSAIALPRIITWEEKKKPSKHQVTISGGSFIATGAELIRFMFCGI